jgi:hypothetical protein
MNHHFLPAHTFERLHLSSKNIGFLIGHTKKDRREKINRNNGGGVWNLHMNVESNKQENDNNVNRNRSKPSGNSRG